MAAAAAYIPYIIAAVGAAASYANTSATARKQDNAAAESIRSQGEIQKRTNAKINETLNKTQADDPEKYRKQASDQYMQAIRAKLGNAQAGLRSGVSGSYDAAASKAANDEASYGTDFAGLAGRLDAPTTQRQAEGFRYGNLGMDLGVEQGNSANQSFLDQLRARGIRRNPWLDAASAAANGYATRSGVGGGGG